MAYLVDHALCDMKQCNENIGWLSKPRTGQKLRGFGREHALWTAPFFKYCELGSGTSIKITVHVPQLLCSLLECDGNESIALRIHMAQTDYILTENNFFFQLMRKG